MTIYEKVIFSLSTIAVIFVLAWILHRLIIKNFTHQWSIILGRSISRALIYISIITSAYITVRIWDLPENQLIIANKFLFALAIIVCTLIIASIASGIIEIYKRIGEHAIAAATLTKNLTVATIFILGVLVLLNHFGIAIAPMLTAMGIGGIAIALGLQDTLSNIFAGLYIIWAGRMQIGDYIKLSTGEEGYVHDIAWRETRIRMALDNIITIPNSLIAKVAIINYSRPSEDVGFVFPVGIDYNSDLDHVEKVTLDVAREVLKSASGGMTNYEPKVRFKKFADSNIDMIIIMRVKDYASQHIVSHELLKKLHKKYKQEHINLPYPTLRIFKEDS